MSNPIELSCKHDPKDPAHLICVERASGSAREERPRRSWKHRFGDFLLIAVVLMLAAVQISAFFRKTAPIAISDVEVKMAARQSEVRVGEEAALTISYLNGSEQVLSRPRLTLRFPDSLNIRTVIGGRREPETSVIVLEDIPALRSGEISVVFDTLSIEKANIEALFEYQDRRDRFYTRKALASVNLRGPDLKVESFARYYSPEGDQIGRGPLPPKVGETTKYKTYWILERPISDFQDVVVEGALQDGVRWTGFAPIDGSGLSFDPITRRVIWRVGDLSSAIETDHTAPAKGVIFEISLTPFSAMAGKEAVLVDQIRVRGKDAKTGLVIEGIGETTTTNLARDARAVGKGVIQP